MGWLGMTSPLFITTYYSTMHKIPPLTLPYIVSCLRSFMEIRKGYYTYFSDNDDIMGFNNPPFITPLVTGMSWLG